MPITHSDVLIVLASLRAEGTPRMVLSMCKHWMRLNLEPAVLDLQRGPPDLEAEFQKLGVPIERAAIGHHGYARYLRLTTAVAQLCRRMRPRAVLCMPFGLHSFVAAGAWAAGVPRTCAHVGNPPDDDTAPATRRKARTIVRIGHPFTHRLICCSKYVQAETARILGVPRTATSVVYNGVDVERFASRARDREPVASGGRKLTVGMTATFEDHKDQDTLIRAAALLSKQGLELEVRLIGDGSRRLELERLIEKEHAPVVILGSRTDMPRELAQLDIFAFSTTRREGLGIAVVEAMAAGLPVIASDVPACRELLEDGALGRLVTAADAEALAAAILDLSRNERAARSVAIHAQQRMRDKFSEETMAGSYLEALGIESAN